MRLKSLQARLFAAFAVVTVIAAAVPVLYMRGNLYEERLLLAGKEAMAQAVFVRRLLEPEPSEDELTRLFEGARELSFRITLLDAQGRVLRDSHVGAQALPNLDNHGDRPEIEDARAKGAGISLRHSNSLGIDAVYAAVPLQSGGTLRIAMPLADIRHDFEASAPSLGLIVGLVAVFCLLLSVFITRRVRHGLEDMGEVVSAIARDKGKHHLLEAPYAEFEPLAASVNQMADSIEEYLSTTADQKSQLETILNSMREGVLVLGPAGNIRRWNKAAEGMFPAVAKAQGKPVIEGIPVPVLQRKVDALLSNKGVDEGPAHFEMPKGRFLMADASRPVDNSGILGAVIVIYDVTELMRLENVRRDFVANISHELRTPLTAIAGYAETLADSPELPEESRRFAGVIHKHALMLGRVISDLLSLARIENAAEAVDAQPVALADPLEAAVAVCASQAADKGVTFNINMAPTPVMADKQLMTQVFRNLLENACRYSPEGGEIRVTSTVQAGQMLVTVSDQGPGIAAGELSRIFERFYQVRKERNSGTSGIGLAICKHIIERHGGRIWAESPWQGASTAMLFTIPLRA